MNRTERFDQLRSILTEQGRTRCLTLLERRMDGLRRDGGAGSGNWGHSGRPGFRGGSMPGGGTKNRIPMEDGGYTSAAKQRRAAAAAAKKKAKPKAEPKRDPREAAKESWKKQTEGKRAETLKGDNADQALEMAHAGVISREEAVQRMRDGTIGEVVNRYYDVLAENGDPTPVKPTVTKQKHANALAREYGVAPTEARTMEIMKDTGASREEAEKMLKELSWFTGSQMWRADKDVLDTYVSKAPAWQGKMYRGLHMEEPGSYDRLMEQIRTGTIQMQGPSSWTSDYETCRRYSHSWDSVDSVEIECVANRTATPIEHLTMYGGEYEVLAGSNTKWSVLSVEESTDPYGARKATVRVIERNDYEDA